MRILKVAKDLKVDGVHIDTTAVCPTSIRKELYPWQLIGATANSLQDCENFINKEVDYIYLAPFRATQNTAKYCVRIKWFYRDPRSLAIRYSDYWGWWY